MNEGGGNLQESVCMSPLDKKEEGLTGIDCLTVKEDSQDISRDLQALEGK